MPKHFMQSSVDLAGNTSILVIKHSLFIIIKQLKLSRRVAAGTMVSLFDVAQTDRLASILGPKPIEIGQIDSDWSAVCFLSKGCFFSPPAFFYLGDASPASAQTDTTL